MDYRKDITKDNPSHILNFAVKLCCTLLNAGSPVSAAERAAYKICFYYGAQSVSAFCLPNAVGITACFSGVEHTSLKRAYYGGNDLFIQEKSFALVRDILCGKLTLQQAERRLLNIQNSGGVNAIASGVGSFIACGSFAIFFGGSALDGFAAAAAGLATSCASSALARRGAGGLVRVFLLSLLSGALSVLLCALFNLFGADCHVSLVIVGTLMTLIPGLTVCNALSDLISGDYMSCTYRVLSGLAQTGCIVAGYAIALTASGGMTAFTAAAPRGDAFRIIICYITSASGAAGFCLTMNARKKRLLYGAAAAALSYTAYVAADALGANEFSAYFIAAAAAYCAAQAPAIYLKLPSNVFVAPAVIPLLPGASMYFAVNALVCGDGGTALACGSDALIIFTAIAAGLAAAQLAARIILPKKRQML